MISLLATRASDMSMTAGRSGMKATVNTIMLRQTAREKTSGLPKAKLV